MTFRRLLLAATLALATTACGSTATKAAQSPTTTTGQASSTATAASTKAFCTAYLGVEHAFANRGVNRTTVRAEVGTLGAQLEATAPPQIRAGVRDYLDALRVAIDALPATGSAAQYGSTMNNVAAKHSADVGKMIGYGSAHCPAH